MRGAWILVLGFSLVMAGCTAQGDDVPVGAPLNAVGASSPVTPALQQHAPPPPAARTEPLDIELSLPWLKPRNVADATVEWPAGTAGRWLVSAHGSRAVATPISSVNYLRGGTSDDTLGSNKPSETPLVDTGNLPPGVLSSELALSQAGAVELKTPRHPDIRLRIDIVDALPRADLEVSLVNDAYGFRFVPSQLVLGVGSTVRFYNEDAVSNAVVDHRIWTQVATNNATISLVGVDPGWYEIAAQTLPSDGVAPREARAFLLVDFEAPTSRTGFGPYGAGNTLLPPDAPREYPLQAPRPIGELALQVTLQGERVSGETRIEVVANGTVVASRFVKESGPVTFRDLPEGALRLRVVDGEGPTHGFELRGDITYAIKVPPPPAWLTPGE